MTRHAAPNPATLSRRAWLALTLAGVWAPSARAQHTLLGPVQPRVPAPRIALTLHDGRRSALPTLLRGRITALHLMFTGCSATCPLQGAIFAALQSRLSDRLPQAQLVSLSIDPLSDDAVALNRWRQTFRAGPRWLAAAPEVRHSDTMLDFLDGRPRRLRGGDRHLPQVVLFDTQGRLAFRCAELAGAADIAVAMSELARVG